MHRVVKQFSFDSAHRLLGYPGKCNQLHGHSYIAEVCFDAESLDSQDMVVDFSVIKAHVGEWIDSNWDHSTLLHEEDPLLKHLTTSSCNVCAFDKNPTAEVMAAELYIVSQSIFEKMASLVTGRVNVVWVRIWETATSYAEYDGV